MGDHFISSMIYTNGTPEHKYGVEFELSTPSAVSFFYIEDRFNFWLLNLESMEHLEILIFEVKN